MDKEELTSRKQALQNRLYLMMVEIIFIFGIPAGIAFFAGRYLDGHFASGRSWTLALLGCAFVASWIFLIKRVRAIGKEIKDVERELREQKQKMTPQQ